MANWLVYNPDSAVVPNRVVRYERSRDALWMDEHEFFNRIEVLDRPAEPFSTLVVDGSTYRVLSAQELANLDAAAAAAALDNAIAQLAFERIEDLATKTPLAILTTAKLKPIL